MIDNATVISYNNNFTVWRNKVAYLPQTQSPSAVIQLLLRWLQLPPTPAQPWGLLSYCHPDLHQALGLTALLAIDLAQWLWLKPASNSFLSYPWPEGSGYPVNWNGNKQLQSLSTNMVGSCIRPIYLYIVTLHMAYPAVPGWGCFQYTVEWPDYTEWKFLDHT